MSGVSESIVEDAALDWLESLGWNVAHGPDIAPDTLAAERADYGQVVLERRLRDALAQLNPDLSCRGARRCLSQAEPAGRDGARKLVTGLSTGMLVEGVTVEYRVG